MSVQISEQIQSAAKAIDKLEQYSKEIIEGIPFLSGVSPLIVASFKAGAIVFGIFVLNFIIKKAVKRLHKKFVRGADYFYAVFVKSTKRPLLAYVWVAGLTIAIDIMNSVFKLKFLNFTEGLRDIAFVLFVTWFFLKLIENYKRRYIINKRKAKKSVDLTTVDMIVKISKFVTFITAAIVFMDKAGISIRGILAFGGISGIAVGFAAKDLLSNFFGAIMIYTDKPFVVGDWISSPDRNIEGVVDSIGWRQTKIISFEKYPIYIPNSVFSTIVVENKGRMKSRRIKEVIGLTYNDVGKVSKIVTQIKNMIEKRTDINQRLGVYVSLDKFDEYSVNILVYTFAKTNDWSKYLEIKQDVLLQINKIIEKNGAEIAFPTSQVMYCNTPKHK